MAKVICCISGANIDGVITFSQSSPFSPTIIDGTINGLPDGKHGISINVFGDLSNGFTNCGPHYNPFGKQHGSPESDERHVGSLGNVLSEERTATFHMENNLVQVIGPYSVIGRSVIVYSKEDDLGKTQSKDSLLNGNVGSPIAGGVIGIAYSIENDASKKRRKRVNKKWIPFKDLTPEEKEQLNRERSRKRLRKELLDMKIKSKEMLSSGVNANFMKSPTVSNEDYEVSRECNITFEENDDDVFYESDIDNKRKQDQGEEYLKEKIMLQKSCIEDLEKEISEHKWELKELEEMMKLYNEKNR